MFYFMMFYLCAAFGLVAETAFSLVTTRKFNDRRTMILSPLCPVYGLGGLAIYLIYRSFGVFPAIILGTLFAVVIEYIYGMICVRAFHIILWDYSNCRYHKNGQICLEFFIVWYALVAVFVLYLIEPTQYIAMNYPISLSSLLLIVFVIDIVFTIRNIRNSKINLYCSVIKYC